MDSAVAVAIPPSSGLIDEPAAPTAVPSLQELCVSYIARHLHLFPSLASLPYHLAELVVSYAQLPALEHADNAFQIRTRGNHRSRAIVSSTACPLSICPRVALTLQRAECATLTCLS